MSASSSFDSEYSSFKSRNSRANGSLMASSGLISSPGFGVSALLEQ
jgi:hypothetical protein